MSRIFTFGCSFVDYTWPTWADIILYNNNGYNFGISGGGFDSILYRILESDRKYKFTPSDKIIVIFTTPLRLDVMLYGNSESKNLYWVAAGQFTNTSYLKYNDELFCIDGLIYKSYNNIILIDNYLKNKKLNYIFGSVNNLYENIGNYFEKFDILDKTKDLISFVKDEVKIKLTDFHTFSLQPKDKWIYSKIYDDNIDYHLRPKDHLLWVKDELIKYMDISINVTDEQIMRIEHEIDIASTQSALYNTLLNKFPEFYNNKSLNVYF
jgi:hypothetical protein